MSLGLEECYARILVDSHISEHDPAFLRQLDPLAYAAAMKRAGADAAMVYACCHNGNCYYPTRVGHMHRNLAGRDLFGETIAALQREQIVPLAYYTVVYQRDAARTHPDWRVTQVDGEQHYRRSWHNCPNHRDYVEFVNAQLSEIVAYDIAGIFIDMTVWPGICMCHSCRTKYLRESGREIPDVLDWGDERWVHFQRSRERWLREFAHEMTDTVKRLKPQVQVTHQFAPILYGWYYGQSPALAEANDYASGDFYGGRNQQRLGTKVLAAFSRRRPYEFMTSRTVNLYDHTSTKAEAELVCSAATTLANGGAYLMIDAINPDGTLEPVAYERLGRVAARLRPFKEKVAQLRPILEADAGLYFSTASHVRLDHNGTSIRRIMDPANHMLAFTDIRPINEVIGTSVVLNRARIPYRIVTALTTDLTGLKTIIVNDAAVMAEAEVERLRQFVCDGGTLVATGMTSFYDMEGRTTGDFALGDVFGVSFSGRRTGRVSYLAPADGALVSCDYPAPIVEAITAEILASVVEPQFDPEDFEQFASFHSNPPGPARAHAGLSINRFGKGRCIYLYSSLLALQQDAQQSFGMELLQAHAPASTILSTNAPAAVEVTLLRGTRQDSRLVCFVNYQQDLPNVPVYDIEARLTFPNTWTPTACTRVSDGAPADWHMDGGSVVLRLPRLETIEMIELS